MEEEVKPKAEEPTIFQRMRGAPITFAIAAINVAVYLWAEQSGGTKDPGIQLQFGAAEPIHVWAGEYWRVATCMFMHFGFMYSSPTMRSKCASPAAA